MGDMQENRSVPRIDCYSRSMSDESIECGMVVDISETGAGLTIPKDTPLFKDMDTEREASSYGCLHLNIFHPDFAEENSLDINANIAWLDYEYSKDRLKLGVHFSEMDDTKSGYVKKFIDWMQKKQNIFLRCELKKCP